MDEFIKDRIKLKKQYNNVDELVAVDEFLGGYKFTFSDDLYFDVLTFWLNKHHMENAKELWSDYFQFANNRRLLKGTYYVFAFGNKLFNVFVDVDKKDPNNSICVEIENKPDEIKEKNVEIDMLNNNFGFSVKNYTTDGHIVKSQAYYSAVNSDHKRIFFQEDEFKQELGEVLEHFDQQPVYILTLSDGLVREVIDQKVNVSANKRLILNGFYENNN